MAKRKKNDLYKQSSALCKQSSDLYTMDVTVDVGVNLSFITTSFKQIGMRLEFGIVVRSTTQQMLEVQLDEA